MKERIILTVLQCLSCLLCVSYSFADNWINTPYGYSLRVEHPRTLVNIQELNIIINRMYGTNAREPYKTFFNRIIDREIKAHSDTALTPSLINLALMYKATGNTDYLEWYKTRLTQYLDQWEADIDPLVQTSALPNGGVLPALQCLVSMDILWSEIEDSYKFRVLDMSRIINVEFVKKSGSKSVYRVDPYHTLSGTNQYMDFGYHDDGLHHVALAFAALFAYDDILSRYTFNPENISSWKAKYLLPESEYSAINFTYPWGALDPNFYLESIREELSDSGYFWNVERRIAGDTKYHTALLGDFGGMYDNAGYDRSEDGTGIFITSIYSNATGEDRLTGQYHDQYRGRFYQQMIVPHAGHMARIWFTRTDSMSPLDSAIALTAYKYQDPYMQYWANQQKTQLLSTSRDYEILTYWHVLLFYDDAVSEALPSTNPLSRYFSGPGLVSMRSSWNSDATFGVFMSGEGISRRYEDANSFILARKEYVMPQSGSRTKDNGVIYDNAMHWWYHIRSASKNTLKIYDPNESYDYKDVSGALVILERGSSITPTGRFSIVPSDNLGGQTFMSNYSTVDGKNPTSDGAAVAGPSRAQKNSDILITESANIIKYEYSPNNYTYSVGDGTLGYSPKVEYFLREFLFLNPDVFVIFDRVKSSNPTLKKVWTTHTQFTPMVDKQALASEPLDTGYGMKSYENANLVKINGAKTKTYVDALLPKQNKVVLRGGYTEFCSQPLSNGTSIVLNKELDIPRALELLLEGGSDLVGSVTISGETKEGVISETVSFVESNFKKKYYTSSIYSGSTYVGGAGFVKDSNANWESDEWKGHLVALSTTYPVPAIIKITGNSSDTVYFDPSIDANYATVRGVTIYRLLATTNKHWKKVNSITTSDMNVDSFVVSIAHCYDTEGVNYYYNKSKPLSERLYSFMHRDNASFDWRADMGQWTVNIEATEAKQLDNFLNVISLKDPGVQKPQTTLIEGDGVSGAIVDDIIVIFANDNVNLNQAQFTVTKAGSFEGLIFNLIPNVSYYTKVTNNTVEISNTNNGGVAGSSSRMGVLKVSISSTGGELPKISAPSNLRTR